MSISEEIYNDHRFIDIGDLPTGFGPYTETGKFKRLMCRPFCVRELSLLYMGQKGGADGLEHVIRAVNMAVSCDVRHLTDGDFEYVMMWLRLNSYPQAPSLVTWICKRLTVIETEGRAFYTASDALKLSTQDLKLKGLVREVCNAENNEIVHNANTIIHTFEDDDIEMVYDDLDFPRISTLLEFHQLREESPELELTASMARWIKEGDTLKEKIVLFESAPDLNQYRRILECKVRYKHGISEDMKLRCRTCGNNVEHSATPDPLTFFADNSEQNILDIQYTLLSEFGLQPSDDMPAKTLLYHHSCLAKDKQAEEENRRLKQAVNR